MTAGLIERILTAAELDGVPRNRGRVVQQPDDQGMVRARAGASGGLLYLRTAHAGGAGGGVLCLLAGGRPGTYQQFGRST